ncbi:MAG TPA: hypothetical protein VK929_09180 [Longimicrobiales bacterium]|nr:hypothetical protein [Longimicrobiales bacterium]
MRKLLMGLMVMSLGVTMTACGGDPSTPSRPDVAGTYQMTQLVFDPQGVLPEVNILERVSGAAPRLVLAPAGEAQLIFEDPATGLITTSTGRYTTPEGAVRIDFGDGDAYRTVLLSRRMVFTGSTSITFEGSAPDGVSRPRLLQLVPEWADEQLLDPVPGQLTVTFTRNP